MVSRTKIMAAIVVVALALQPVTIATATATDVSTPTASDPLSVGDVPETTHDETETNGTETNETHPPDPEKDVLGWENGYWYNESISVTPEDGLNESELDAVVARSMARVEQVRQLEFEETIPVEVISREEHSEQVVNQSNATTARRLRANTMFEALFMVNESANVIRDAEQNRAAWLGYYGDEEIKIISENATTPKMDEIVLSQELFHALQDQQFNLSSVGNPTTTEEARARHGIVEGDANYVDYLYQKRCENEWNGTCIMPERSQSGSNADVDTHVGLQMLTYQPYSDGPAFVRDIQELGGWSAVNAIYDNPPASTEQTIHPEKYGKDAPTSVSIEDRSDDRWRPLDINGTVNYASFGEAGLYMMLWYPGSETNGAIDIIPYTNIVNDDRPGELNPYNYDHRYTAGWDGDKLVPYVTDESSATNETGYVYKTIWDSPDDAEEFQYGYEQLLEFHDAVSVEGYENVYRIPDGQEFNDAFYLDRDGETFTVVNAPSIEELSAVREGAAPEVEETTKTDGSAETDDSTTDTDEATGTDVSTAEIDTAAETDDSTTESQDGTDRQSTETTTASGPGFTLGAAILALVGFVLVVSRRR
ncbi:Uncharacterized protein SVXHr_0644 [Halorhabdus sp. SVX81]|uniref:Hvo_1808 family surface protein n=1 Tax=Halorhabdus sp. SVX81 TaxID=2978283 RepID=UPI0023DAD603|nr:Hvo_1808 family surface protein [Halorhabdus sp. SVX81]WEL16823.1 Uncharacterized protein SVXHr_0644 [Halorhabdus sp. SVX81]